MLVFLALWAGIGIRNAALAIIGIPFCYLVAIIFMGAIGVSINAISLFAMVLVSGVIVDDALIVLENIYRHLEEKMPFKEAVVRGTAEVFWPVFSSTLTTVAAFLPMLLMVGVSGEFFSIIPKVVVVTLVASVFECFVVLPVHYLDFGQRLKEKEPHFTRPGFLMQALDRLRTRYEVRARHLPPPPLRDARLAPRGRDRAGDRAVGERSTRHALPVRLPGLSRQHGDAGRRVARTDGASPPSSVDDLLHLINDRRAICRPDRRLVDHAGGDVHRRQLRARRAKRRAGVRVAQAGDRRRSLGGARLRHAPPRAHPHEPGR